MTSRERERHTSEPNRHLKEAASSSIADSFPPKEIGGRVLRFTPRKREPRKGRRLARECRTRSLPGAGLKEIRG